MREQAKQNPNGSFLELKQGVKQAISDEVERCLCLWGSAGRAAEVLEQCQPWLPVEHLVVHNIRVKKDQQLKTVLLNGTHKNFTERASFFLFITPSILNRLQRMQQWLCPNHPYYEPLKFEF